MILLYSELAYSENMQMILFFISTANSLLLSVLTMKLTMALYGEKCSIKRQTLFVFLTGFVLSTAWVYSWYLIGGGDDFSAVAYSLITIPNPLFALVYYFLGIKILLLSSHNSVRLMRIIYLLQIFIFCVSQLISTQFFPQQKGKPFNYLLDILALLTSSVISIFALFIAFYFISYKKMMIRLKDSTPEKKLFKALFFSFFQALMIYLLVIITKYFITPMNFAFSCIIVILAASLVLSTILNHERSIKVELYNRNIYISNLTKVVEDFSGLKHDFHNILQSYSGYLAINDTERLKSYHEHLMKTVKITGMQVSLNHRLAQNTALATVLISKSNLALSRDICFEMDIMCDIKEMYIDETELCNLLSEMLNYFLISVSSFKTKMIRIFIDEIDEGKKRIEIKVPLEIENKANENNKIYILLHSYLLKYENVSYSTSYYMDEFISTIVINKN